MHLMKALEGVRAMITEIDWRYWRMMPEVTQWEACALSLRINPEDMRHHPDAWMGGPGAPIFTNAGFSSAEIFKEFEKRRRLLESSVFTSGFFPTVRGLVMGARWKTTIRLDEFATWLSHVGLEMQPELCALPSPVLQASTPQAAPASETVTPTDWIVNAREIASAYIDRHKRQDLFPSQADVCREVETKLREKRIFGSHDKPLSAAYIGRNALQGEWWKQNKP